MEMKAVEIEQRGNNKIYCKGVLISESLEELERAVKEMIETRKIYNAWNNLIETDRILKRIDYDSLVHYKSRILNKIVRRGEVGLIRLYDKMLKQQGKELGINEEDKKSMMKKAARVGQKDVMKYLHEELETPLDMKLYEKIEYSKARSKECERYLYENGYIKEKMQLTKQLEQ
jgi:hypothetical protein